MIKIITVQNNPGHLGIDEMMTTLNHDKQRVLMKLKHNTIVGQIIPRYKFDKAFRATNYEKGAKGVSSWSHYSVDSTTIDLCLSLSGYAKFQKTGAGIKLHDVLVVSNARQHAVTIGRRIKIQRGKLRCP